MNEYDFLKGALATIVIIGLVVVFVYYMAGSL